MGDYFQRSFVGGMDMLSKDTDISPTAYRYCVNARQRYGKMRAIQKSTDITYNLPSGGNFQGFLGVGNVWVCFVDGNAYYMPINGTAWFQVPFFSMDADVDFIYFCAVPGATNNYLRSAISTDTTINGVTTSAVNANAGIIQEPFTTSGTPAGLICQDGINQPWILTYDNVNNNVTARLLGTYSQWDNTGTSNNSQEYVPIGKMMMYLSPILYIVAPNNLSIYRSVSGAPLNFMVNIDINGNKLPSESLGGAATTSFAVDFDPITSISISTSAANTFVVSTNRTIYGMTPDLTTTIFGEPTFDVSFSLQAGIVNHVSTTDILGNTAFVDFEGVKSFNAVTQIKFSGRNDPFSKNLSNAIDGILQTQPCVWSFDNYNFFSLNTTFGNVLAVYDNFNTVWVGFDITQVTVGGVKQFGQADFLDTSYLGCITQEGKVYSLFTSAVEETAYVQLRAFCVGTYLYGTFIADKLSKEHKITVARVVLDDFTDNGIFWFIEQVDDQRGEAIKQTINGKTLGVNYPVLPPIIASSNGTLLQNLTFTPQNALEGYKINPIIQWNSGAQIEQVMLSTTGQDAVVSGGQQSLILTK